MMNSNGMDVVLSENSIQYRMIGGVIDLYFLAGPTPNAVNDQLTQIIGRPVMPPYWAQGLMQSKCAPAVAASSDCISGTSAMLCLAAEPLFLVAASFVCMSGTSAMLYAAYEPLLLVRTAIVSQLTSACVHVWSSLQHTMSSSYLMCYAWRLMTYDHHFATTFELYVYVYESG